MGNTEMDYDNLELNSDGFPLQQFESTAAALEYITHRWGADLAKRIREVLPEYYEVHLRYGRTDTATWQAGFSGFFVLLIDKTSGATYIRAVPTPG